MLTILYQMDDEMSLMVIQKSLQTYSEPTGKKKKNNFDANYNIILHAIFAIHVYSNNI